MSTSTYLVSAAVMGVLLTGVFVVLVRGHTWYRYSPTGQSSLAGRSSSSSGSPLATDRTPPDDPDVLPDTDSNVERWAVSFVVLCLVAIVLTVSAFDGGDVLAVLGFLVAAVVAFLSYGVYAAARAHDHPHSHAVAEALVTIGALGLVSVVGWLLLTAGA